MSPLAVIWLNVGLPVVPKFVSWIGDALAPTVLVNLPCVSLATKVSTTEVPFTWTWLAFTIPLALMTPLAVMFH